MIGKRQLQKLAAKIQRENPDQLNPQNADEACLYQNWSKVNKRRCFVGQMLYELGLRVPGPRVVKSFCELDRSYHDDFTPEALEYLNDLQKLADAATTLYEVPWGRLGSVYEPVKSRRNLRKKSK